MRCGASEGYLGCCAAIRDADERERLSAIRCPTMVVSGTHDVATPPVPGRALAAAIAGARYVELDAAHLSNVEAADAFNEALAAFLET
jgi:3-oxoadipate enol-lactonase